MLTKDFLEQIYSSSISELLLVDYLNEGTNKAFDLKILQSSLIKEIEIPIILFGGISTPKIAKQILKKENVAGVSIGNYLSYKENSIQTLKNNIDISSIRKHSFYNA